MGKGLHEKLESPLNTPQVQADKDRQARGALRKSARGHVKRAEGMERENAKAERASYRLNRKDKF